MIIYKGKLVSEQIRMGIVAARFNELITPKLSGGTLNGLKRLNVRGEEIDVAWALGVSEIPLATTKVAVSRKYDTIICPGTVICGSTSHYDYVCNGMSKSTAQAPLPNGLPVILGVLTTDTTEQVIERAGTKTDNRGYGCALGAIEMVNLFRGMGMWHGKMNGQSPESPGQIPRR